MRIEFADAVVTPGTRTRHYDLLIGTLGTLRIEIDGKTFLIEEDFPVLELRVESARWLRKSGRAPFAFVPLEHDDDSPLLRVQTAGRASLLSSSRQKFEAPLQPAENVRRAFATYVGAVDAWMSSVIGIDPRRRIRMR